MSGEIATASAALLAVLGLIWLAAWALRAFRPAARRDGGQELFVRQVLALDARRRVHLIACEGRRVLVLTGGPSDVVLGWLAAADDAKAGDA